MPKPLRWIGFRVVAVLLGLLPLAAVEGAFRALDLGQPDLSIDPFVGFSERWPLFTRVREAGGDSYAIPPSHGKFFRPARFPAVKPAGEFRIFVLGGSTVQGSPFSTETSFTTWLEIGLNALDPSRSWRVVNCGGISYATYRLAPILEEVLGYQPDLILFCEGHNEFLEDRTYDALKDLPRFVRTPLALASRLRTFQVVRGLVAPVAEAAEPPARLGPEVQALLDYQGGLDAYHRDDAWRAQVVAHFAFNLERMVRAAREARVPLILINPVSNLDHPPFKSQHRDDITPAEVARFDALLEEARSLYPSDMAAAVARLERARDLDGRHAGLHYNLAKCDQALGRVDEAHAAFLRARDEDVCPLRMLGPMSRILLDVARRSGTPVFDADAFFAARSRDGITGGDWLVDHVHPSIDGHRAWGAALVDFLARLGIARPDPARQAERLRREREHLASLDDAYFLLGEKRLNNQRLWSEGRGNLVRTPATPAGPMTAGAAEGHATPPPARLDRVSRSG